MDAVIKKLAQQLHCHDTNITICLGGSNIGREIPIIATSHVSVCISVLQIVDGNQKA